MKLNKLLLALGAALMVNSAEAVTVILDSGGFTQAVTTANNVPIAQGSGFISTGYFSSFTSGTNFSVLNGSQVALDFVSFGPTSAFAGSAFPGFYTLQADGGRVGAASPYLGKSVYTVVGNGTTLANSTQLLVYQHNFTFPNDEAAVLPASLNATLGGGGTYVFGGPTGGTTTVAGQPIAAIALATLVPEPSTMMLGALGALGLLRRRR